MEDVTAVHFERANGVEFASFAIFDGHGGREASHFAKVRFFSKFKTFNFFMKKGQFDELYQKRKGLLFNEMRYSEESNQTGIPCLSRSNASQIT